MDMHVNMANEQTFIWKNAGYILTIEDFSNVGNFISNSIDEY